MNDFLWGAIFATSTAIGIVFLRFWRDGRDRFFAFFSAAFFTLGAYWLLLGFADPPSETRHYFYLVRLLAFFFIIAGILHKNLAARSR